MKRLLLIALLYAAVATLPAFGQGCAMCWNSATGADERGKSALSRAVTVLLVPPLGLMAGIAGLSIRYAKRRDGDLEKEDLEKEEQV